jgi:hypothetical protein
VLLGGQHITGFLFIRIHCTRLFELTHWHLEVIALNRLLLAGCNHIYIYILFLSCSINVESIENQTINSFSRRWYFKAPYKKLVSSKIYGCAGCATEDTLDFVFSCRHSEPTFHGALGRCGIRPCCRLLRLSFVELEMDGNGHVSQHDPQVTIFLVTTWSSVTTGWLGGTPILGNLQIYMMLPHYAALKVFFHGFDSLEFCAVLLM